MTAASGADPRFRIVAVAASLGGVTALGALLAHLPADSPLPILVCRHVERGKPSLLPAVLARRTKLRVSDAAPGNVPVSGQVYVAPPDHHLVLRPDGVLDLTEEPPVNFSRPSADVLFGSVARACGLGAIAVVLTGRGRDGGHGVEHTRRHGGFAIAEDATAEAPDMPLAAVAIGHADRVLPLERIAGGLQALAGTPAAPNLPSAPALPPSETLPRNGRRRQPPRRRVRCSSST